MNTPMSGVLGRICSDKREHIAACRTVRSLSALESLAKEQSRPRGFEAALKRAAAENRFPLIAEIKKASPSKGLIRSDFEPRNLAAAYFEGGAACLSVLTDMPYFQGHDDYLVAARDTVPLPALRKDFMLDPYQIVEARALGADCVLLIMAALEDAQAAELESVAADWDMDVLIEVHDDLELDRALKLKSSLLGVNNRNLKTLEVDTRTTANLAARVPAECFLVAESGLYNHADLEAMRAAGARAFLVGESLMRQDDVTLATKTLLQGAA